MAPLWKPSRTDRKKLTLSRRRERKQNEDGAKAEVRKRDKFRCRFPLCGCGKLKLPLEVSHDFHKGIGGNPKGDRSTPEIMVLLCNHRHQYGKVSRHAGTLRALAQTGDGYNGPVTWQVEGSALGMPEWDGQWIELARESSPGVLEPLTDWQREALTQLAMMVR